MKAWVVISIDLLLLAGGEWWLIGGSSNWRGWAAAILALAGLTELLVGLLDLREALDLRSVAAAIVGALMTGGAIWISPSWRWTASGAWVVVVIVVTDRLDRFLTTSDPGEPPS